MSAEPIEATDALSLADPYTVPTRYWHELADGRIQCDVCPRACKLREGQRGLCFVRGRIDDQVVLASYGRSSGFCVDPVEKKPLNHFLPGTPVLSFGTAGCNLACRSVAFTYNDPVIFMEYAMDVADACHARGIRAVAVSAGYMNHAPREEFYRHMDAANIDLKAFTDSFYQKITFARLPVVLETLEYLRGTDVWFEVTTLLIPGHNDAPDEIRAECDWFVEHLGPDVPLHFSAFHPDFKMLDVPRTPPETLRMARRIALERGLRYVYTGNAHDPEGGTTRCPGCGVAVVVRDWYDIRQYELTDTGACIH